MYIWISECVFTKYYAADIFISYPERVRGHNNQFPTESLAPPKKHMHRTRTLAERLSVARFRFSVRVLLASYHQKVSNFTDF